MVSCVEDFDLIAWSSCCSKKVITCLRPSEMPTTFWMCLLTFLWTAAQFSRNMLEINKCGMSKCSKDSQMLALLPKDPFFKVKKKTHTHTHTKETILSPNDPIFWIFDKKLQFCSANTPFFKNFHQNLWKSTICFKFYHWKTPFFVWKLTSLFSFFFFCDFSLLPAFTLKTRKVHSCLC